MKNNKFNLSAIYLVCLTFIWGCTSTLDINDGGTVKFISESDGYSLRHPSNWIALETPNGQHGDDEISGILTVPFGDSPNIYIARKTTTTSPSIEEALEWGKFRILSRYESSDEVQSITLNEPEYAEQDNIKIASRYYVIDFKNSDYELLMMEDNYIIIDDEMFILTLSSPATTFDTDVVTFHEIVDSFRLIE